MNPFTPIISQATQALTMVPAAILTAVLIMMVFAAIMALSAKRS